jgi:hypothetical protein
MALEHINRGPRKHVLINRFGGKAVRHTVLSGLTNSTSGAPLTVALPVSG